MALLGMMFNPCFSDCYIECQVSGLVTIFKGKVKSVNWTGGIM